MKVVGADQLRAMPSALTLKRPASSLCPRGRTTDYEEITVRVPVSGGFLLAQSLLAAVPIPADVISLRARIYG